MSSRRTAIRNGERVSIKEVPSGKNEGRLFCSGMCGENVIAKKGRFNEHHFAHGPNSKCSYYDKTGGGGGKGQNHQDAQDNFIKMYEDPNVKMRVNYHPPCANGSNCKETIQIDIKEKFPPSEYIMETEYTYKKDECNYCLDLVLLPRRAENKSPGLVIEIIDSHKTKECEREKIGREWLSIRADPINRFYEDNKRTLDGLKTAHCGDIDITAVFNCIRDKFIDERCKLCLIEYEKSRIASEKLRCERLQQQKDESDRQHREAERKLQQQRDEAEKKLLQQAEEEKRKLQNDAERQQRQTRYIEECKQRDAEYEAARQRLEAARQLQQEKQRQDAIIQANIREKDKRKMRMLDKTEDERKSRLKDIFDILKSPTIRRKIEKKNMLHDLVRIVKRVEPHKKTYKNNKRVKCERCSKMGSSVCYHKTPKIREQIEYEEGEEHDELDNKKNKIYYCANCNELIAHFKREGYGYNAYKY